MQTHSILSQLSTAIQAGYSCFYLHTAEAQRAEFLLNQVASTLNFNVLEYNLAQGKICFTDKHQQKENNGRIEQSLNDLFDEDLERKLIFIKNAKLALENNPVAIARLQHLIEKIERHYRGECAIILQAAEIYMPADLEPLMSLIELPLPQTEEIRPLVAKHFPTLDATRLSPIATALSGLTENDIDKLLVLILLNFLLKFHRLHGSGFPYLGLPTPDAHLACGKWRSLTRHGLGCRNGNL